MPECPRCGASHEEHARFCSACGYHLGSASDAEPLETRKHVTAVFCDLVGSTGLGERLDPEPLAILLQRYFDLTSTIFNEHGGAVREFIGDAVLAVFGVSETHEDDALRALRASLEVLAGIEAMNREHGSSVHLAVRIGVNTGEVLTGRSSAGQPLLLGDAVNVAAHLERLAEPGHILVGQETARAARGLDDSEPFGTVDVKGRTEPVVARRLIGLRDPQDDAPFVGRDRELSRMTELFRRVQDSGLPNAVVVLGEAGIGKSRTVREFRARSGPASRWMTARCASYGSTIYAPFAAMLREGVIHPVADDRSHDLMFHVDAAARSVLGSMLGDGEPPSIDEVAVAFGQLLERLAADRPLVAVVEDLHWAPTSTIDLIATLVRQVRAPILFLLTMRPREGPSETPLPVGWRSIHLEPLSVAEANALIDRQLPGVPSEGRRRVASTTRGNPLFIVEASRAIRDTGVDPGDDGGLPTSIRSLLDARLERLAAPSRMALEAAAVIGEVVPTVLLEAAGGAHAADPAIHALRDRAILIDEAPDRLAFSHPLVREAAYRSVPKRRRADLHVAVADAWWSGYRNGSDDPDLVMGQHLARAAACRRDVELDPASADRLAERAAEHLAEVARRSEEVGDSLLAGELYGRVIDLLPAGHDAAADARVRCSLAFSETGRWQDAEDLARQAMEEARHGGDVLREARARVALGRMWMASIDPRMYGELPPIVDPAIEVLEDAGDHEWLAHAWFVACVVPWNDMRAGDCIDALERAAAHARSAGRRSLELDSLSARATAWLRGPTPVPEALGLCEELLRDERSTGRVRFRVLLARAELQAMAGRFDQAWVDLDEVDELNRRMFGSVQLIAVEFRYHVHIHAGDPGGALTAIQGWEEGLPDDAAGFLEVLRARCYLELGRDADANDALVIAEALMHPGDRIMQVYLAGIRGLLLARTGDRESGIAEARRSVELAACGDFPIEHGDAWRWLAETYRAADLPAEAAEAGGRAMDLYREKGALPWVERMQRWMDPSSAGGGVIRIAP